MTQEWEDPFSEPVHIPIEGVLDLHAFRPGDIRHLVPEYLSACYAEGLREVTLIHGKGTGALREAVHALLRRNPLVKHFDLDREQGNWGITRVFLVDP